MATTASVVQPTATPVEEKKTVKTTRKKSVKAEKAAKASAPVPAVEVETQQPAAEGAGVKKPRRTVDKQTVLQSLLDLQQGCAAHIEGLQGEGEEKKAKSKKPATGIKFLRGVNKTLKMIAKDYRRAMKIRPPPVIDPNNPNPPPQRSGFRKKYPIVQRLQDFLTTHCELKELEKEYSRIDVTKILCGYIKTKNLKYAKDGRVIVLSGNPALRTLLFGDEKGEVKSVPEARRVKKIVNPDGTKREEVIETVKDAIFYSGIQKQIGCFFNKPPPTEKKAKTEGAAVAVAAPVVATPAVPAVPVVAPNATEPAAAPKKSAGRRVLLKTTVKKT